MIGGCRTAIVGELPADGNVDLVHVCTRTGAPWAGGGGS